MFIDDQWAKTDLHSPIALYASHPLSELRNLKPILLMGGIHGDEPLGVELAKKTLEMLLADAAQQQPQFKVPWALIPCLNIDGYKQNTRVNGRGVDLNRNYPSKSWSPEAAKERYNPGPSPGSEAEIQAVGLRFAELLTEFFNICDFH